MLVHWMNCATCCAHEKNVRMRAYFADRKVIQSKFAVSAIIFGFGMHQGGAQELFFVWICHGGRCNVKQERVGGRPGGRGGTVTAAVAARKDRK